MGQPTRIVGPRSADQSLTHTVRNQILIYAVVLIAGVRIDGTGSITMIEGWANDQEQYPIVDEMESDTRFGKR